MGLLDRWRRDRAENLRRMRKPQVAPDVTDEDRLVLEQLQQHGADLSQSREVNHYLYVPTREAADALAAIVLNEGHEASVRESAGGDESKPWLVVATSHTVVDPEGVAAARRVFTELASEYGGEYDGWEAAV